MRLELNHSTLKTKQRQIRHGFPENMGLRVHRAISWIGRAEAEDADCDAKFLFLWIAFNAAYADETEFQRVAPAERDSFARFFGKLVRLDRDRRVYDAIWTRFSGPIRLLLHNRFVFSLFWQHQNGIDGYEDWEEHFAESSRRFAKAVANGDTPRILSFVFDRLYVLRNQLMHGGSTWNSSVNRQQVQDGAAILGFLLPMFVDIMMDHPFEEWGRPFYPVVND